MGSFLNILSFPVARCYEGILGKSSKQFAHGLRGFCLYTILSPLRSAVIFDDQERLCPSFSTKSAFVYRKINNQW